MTGIAVVAGYALLGATWLSLKTEGALQDRCYGLARPLTLVLLFFFAVVGIWTPMSQPAIAERWFSFPAIVWLAPLPLSSAIAGVAMWRSLKKRRELAPFVLGYTVHTYRLFRGKTTTGEGYG